MTDVLRTPFDEQISKAKAKAEASKKRAEDLAIRAKNAAREARKEFQKLEGMDRKKRDRARYIVGGVIMARMLRQEPDAVRRWLDTASLSEKDRTIVENELSSVLNRTVPTPDGERVQ